jgi:hypothetical protein
MLIESNFCSFSVTTLLTVTVFTIELVGTIGGEERVGVDTDGKEEEEEEEEEEDERGDDEGIDGRAREGDRGGDRDRDREGEDMYDGDREE